MQLYAQTLSGMNQLNYYRDVPVCLRCASVYRALSRSRRRVLQHRFASTSDDRFVVFDTRPPSPHPVPQDSPRRPSMFEPPPLAGRRRPGAPPTVGRAPQFSNRTRERIVPAVSESEDALLLQRSGSAKVWMSKSTSEADLMRLKRLEKDRSRRKHGKLRRGSSRRGHKEGKRKASVPGAREPLGSFNRAS